MWQIDPTVESPLLNVHGLAHKVVFDAEFSVSDSNRDMYELPLYDPLDDDSIEAFAIVSGEKHIGNVVLDQIDRYHGKARFSIYIGEPDNVVTAFLRCDRGEAHTDHPLYIEQQSGITKKRLGKIYASEVCDRRKMANDGVKG